MFVYVLIDGVNNEVGTFDSIGKILKNYYCDKPVILEPITDSNNWLEYVIVYNENVVGTIYEREVK